MSRKYAHLDGLVLFVGIPLFLAGCHDPNIGPPVVDDPVDLIDEYAFEEAEPIVTPSEATLEVGQSLKLQREWQDGDENYEALSRSVHWSSDNPLVAAVDQDGTVRALREGKATITASDKDGMGQAKIVVIAP